MFELLVLRVAADQLPDVPRREAFAAEFLALLTERAARFTMGDSTSVRLETAEAMARSLQYCISLALPAANEPKIETRSARELYESGLLEARRRIKRAALLLRQAESLRPPVENVAFRDTLAALPDFFRRYDPEFFACEIPCDIDYPLCAPVPESKAGVDYVLDYLRRLNTESAFLRRFPAPLLALAYERYYGDDGLLVNLYEPVAAAAVGRALAGKAVKNLFTDAEDRGRIALALNGAGEEGAEALLAKAAETACAELDIASAFDRAYCRSAALALLPRLRAAAPEDGYAGIFVPAQLFIENGAIRV